MSELQAVRYVDAMPLGRKWRYGLTFHQAAVYRAIVSHREQIGIMPSIREIAEVTGLPVVRIQDALSNLAARGWIKKHRHDSGYMQARGIELLEPVLHLKEPKI